MQYQSDITIVGGGLLGAALAIRLAKFSDLKIQIIERGAPLNAPKHANQRVLALGHLAAEFLRQIDVFQKLGASERHAYQAMHVWDASSAGELRFSAQELDQPQLGWMVDAQKLSYELQQILRQHNQIQCFFELKLNQLECAGDEILLSDGEQVFTSRLAIAADGAHSWLRRQSQIFSNQMAYEQRGIVATISSSEPHQDCAWQRFLSTGPVAVLPLANGDSSIVWSVDTDFSDELMAMPDTDFEVALSKALDQRLGATQLRSPRQAFPLVSQSASAYVKARLALVGDAAHSIHPLAGQGANLGFKDIARLSQILLNEDVANIGDLKVLGRYERSRRKDNQQTDQLMTALHYVYQNDDPIWASIRGLGMNLINRSDRLRQLLANHAMGL